MYNLTIFYSSFRNTLIALLSVVLSQLAVTPTRRAVRLTFCKMDFSVEHLNRFEKELSLAMNEILKMSKAQSVTELNHSRLMAVNKDPLATAVENLSKLMTSNLELCKSAASTIDKLKSDQLNYQKDQIKQQQEQLDSFKTTVHTEMKTAWSDIVKKNCETSTSTPSINSIKTAVKTVVEDDIRSKNFIIYGVPEDYSPDPHLVAEEVIELIWESSGCDPKVVAAHSIGTKTNSGSGKPRPIKVTLSCAESVKMVLARARNLKKSKCTAYHTWYITPDRSKEERAAHQKLVVKVKEMITAQPTKYHYIRDGKIFSVDKVKV